MWSVSNVKMSEFHGMSRILEALANGRIKINVINAHVRTVLEVTRSRISHHLLQKVVSLCSL